MRRLTKALFALAAPLFLTSCLWGPGKFTSDLTLLKSGSFILDYKGEIVLQTPPDAAEKAEPWKNEMARCHKSGRAEVDMLPADVKEADADMDDALPEAEQDPTRPCTAAEIAKLKAQYEKDSAE